MVLFLRRTLCCLVWSSQPTFISVIFVYRHATNFPRLAHCIDEARIGWKLYLWYVINLSRVLCILVPVVVMVEIFYLYWLQVLFHLKLV